MTDEDGEGARGVTDPEAVDPAVDGVLKTGASPCECRATGECDP